VDDRVLRSAMQRLGADNRDESAWRELYVALYPFLFATLFRIFHANSFLAEESAQEAMVRLLRNFNFRTPGVSVASLVDYLNRTMRSVASDLMKKEKRREGQRELEAIDDDQLASEIGSPEGSVILANLLENVKTDLSPRETQVLEMLLLGASNEAISNALSISSKTVYNLTSDLRAKLRAMLFPRPGKKL
jgi:RNA polymerase sigma factor (sigma-70 family)